MPTSFRAPEIFERRRADWRVGPVIYQIFVDRFAPSKRLKEKAAHYAEPRKLREWQEVPEKGPYLAEHLISEAEVQFWGGDLESIRERIGYLRELGVEVVYLNPIFHAFSNHKYDAIDYRTIDPQYGTDEDLRALVNELHAQGMRLMLDGVFNHVGRRAPMFEKERSGQNGKSNFFFGGEFRHGYRGWRNVANLPELNLENDALRSELWEAETSVVQTYLRDHDIDGWRLDVAPDVGFDYLRSLTQAAHLAKPGCSVIGECWNYPEEWLGVLDGVMNMHVRTLLMEMAAGKISAAVTGRALQRMVDDSDFEGLLRSHFVLDNHDLPRLRHLAANDETRSLLRTLQFLLPGAPVIYYGSELGMEGGHDPLNRAPMRWDLHDGKNAEYDLVRKLVTMREENAALRIGEFRVLESDRLLAFLRMTDRARETILVLANPTDEPVTDVVPVRDSRLMDAAPMRCLLSDEQVVLHCGLVEHRIPPRSVRIFRTLDQGVTPGYSMFKRVG
ncbi:cyclomaltodextrinase [soil metagenome]